MWDEWLERVGTHGVYTTSKKLVKPCCRAIKRIWITRTPSWILRLKNGNFLFPMHPHPHLNIQSDERYVKSSCSNWAIVSYGPTGKFTLYCSSGFRLSVQSLVCLKRGLNVSSLKVGRVSSILKPALVRPVSKTKRWFSDWWMCLSYLHNVFDIGNTSQ